jgi:flagellin FlaB
MCRLRDEQAFTGLEAAIVLIAFITVAAVFSYVVLNLGMSTTQKSQETIYAGAGQAGSALVLSGPVMIESDTENSVRNISFYLQSGPEGSSVDMKKTVYLVSTKKKMQTFMDSSAPGGYRISRFPVKSVSLNDDLLESREIIRIEINLKEAGFDANTLTTYDQITIEVQSPAHAALVITRTIPPGMTGGNFYEIS